MLTEDQRKRLRVSFHAVVGGCKFLTGRQAAQIAAETDLTVRTVEDFALQQGAVPRRYERNIGTLGLDGQRRLLAGRVVVVGLGGLGGHVTEVLARLGVGRIAGVDGDVLAESDLNRQLLSNVENLGVSKAAQAAVHVSRINPAVEFTAHETTFEQLEDKVFCGCDLVFDCLDSIPARRLLARRCAAASVTLVHGAIAGWCGQVGICLPGSGMLDKVYKGVEHGIEQRTGNLPFTAAVAANMMVARAVAVLLGRDTATGPRLEFFDLLASQWQTVEL